MLLNSINSSQKSLFSTQSPKKEALPSFQGFTKYVANTPHSPHKFFSTEDFLKIASCFRSKIAGKLPKEFLSYYPQKPSEVFKFFDEFAVMARNMGNDKKLLVHFDIELPSGKKLQVKNLGKGEFGNVYKLNTDNKDFAFKAFYNNFIDDNHGSAAEPRTYLHFCDKNYKNINKFHIANVEDGKNWIVSEYIDEEIAKRKKGANVKDVHPELSFFDDSNKNEISEVRVDMGGIGKKKFDLSDFAEKDREKIFYEKLNSQNFNDRKNIANQIEHLPIEGVAREKAFYAVLNSEHPEVRAGISSQIRWAVTGEAREKAFYDVLNSKHPEVRAGISSQIYSLPRKDGVMEKAFYDVLNSEHPEVREGISSQIVFLSEEGGVREKAFYEVLKSEHPEVRSGISSQISYLSEKNGVMKKAFYDVLKSEHPEVRAGIASQIISLPEEDRKKAFYDVLNSEHPEVREGIALQILSFPREDRKQAFYDVLNSEHPDVREGIAKRIKYLPEEDKNDAKIALIKKFAEGNKTFKVTNIEIEKAPN